MERTFLLALLLSGTSAMQSSNSQSQTNLFDVLYQAQPHQAPSVPIAPTEPPPETTQTSNTAQTIDQMPIITDPSLQKPSFFDLYGATGTSRQMDPQILQYSDPSAPASGSTSSSQTTGTSVSSQYTVNAQTGPNQEPVQSQAVANAGTQTEPQQPPQTNTGVQSPTQMLPKNMIPQTGPQNVPQMMPQTVPQTMPQTGPQNVPQMMPQTVPQTMPQTGPQNVPQMMPRTVPQPGPQTVPQMMPQPGPQTVPQMMPRTGPQVVPGMMPQPGPQTVPGMMPQTGRQTVPGMMPQTGTQIVPQMLPQTLPQTGPQKMPQVMPRAMPQAVPQRMPPKMSQIMPQTMPKTLPKSMAPSMSPMARQPMPSNFPPQISKPFPGMGNNLVGPQKPFSPISNIPFQQNTDPFWMNFPTPPNNWMNIMNNLPVPPYNPYVNNPYSSASYNPPQWAISSPWMQPIGNSFGNPYELPNMNIGSSNPYIGPFQPGPLPGINQKSNKPGSNSVQMSGIGGNNIGTGGIGSSRRGSGGFGSGSMGIDGMGSKTMRGSNRGSSIMGSSTSNSGTGQYGLPEGAAKPHGPVDMMKTLMMVQAITGEPIELPMAARGRGMGALGIPGVNGLGGLGTGANAGLGPFGALLGEGLGAAFAAMQLAPQLGNALTGTGSTSGSTGFGSTTSGFGSTTSGVGDFGISTTQSGLGRSQGSTQAGGAQSLLQMMNDPATRALMTAFGIDLPDLPPAAQRGVGGALGSTQTPSLWRSQTSFDPIAAPITGTGTADLFSFGSTTGSGAGTAGANFGLASFFF